MNSNQLSSYIRRERETFRSPKQGPIPNSVLDNLLSEAEAILEQELAQHDSKQALGGIRLGYQIEKSDYTVESYWIGFGYDSIYEKLLKFTELPTNQEADEKNSSSTIPLAREGLRDEVMYELTNRIKNELHNQLPDGIDKNNVHAWIFAHTVGWIGPLSLLLRSKTFSAAFIPDNSLVNLRSVAGKLGCCRNANPPRHRTVRGCNPPSNTQCCDA